MSEGNIVIQGYEGDITGKSGVLRTTLSSEELLADLERRLLGKEIRENKEGDIFEKQVGKPLMNEDGVRAIIRSITLYASKDIKLSNIDKQEQNKIIQGIAQNFVISIANNAHKWNLAFEDFDDLVELCTLYAFIALSRGVGAKELDHVYTQTRRESIEQRQDQRASFSDTRKAGIFNNKNNSREEMNR